MSWSGSATVTLPVGFAIDDIACTGQTDVPEEMARQVAAAKEAARQMLASHVYDNAEEVSVVLSGHANPNHLAATNWANDTISVSVTITKYRPPSALGW